jgi:nicotinamidase-related amidase
MSDVHYDASRTQLLLVDPYNDFLSDGGKLWPMVKDVAGEVGLLDNLRSIVAAARAADIRVFFVPHRRWVPGDGDDWFYPNPSQCSVQKRQTFAKGNWGGEWHPDFVPQAGDILVKEHWAQSGFANTDLDFPTQAARRHACRSPSACSPTPALSPLPDTPWSWAIT